MDVEESPWADTNQPSQASSKDDEEAPATSQATSQAASTSSAPRPQRGPRRMVAQPTRLEAVDDPLGPLGAAPPTEDDAATTPPAPPQKEQMVVRTTMPPQQQKLPADSQFMGEEDADEKQSGGRAPPPVEAARPSSVRSNTQPSVSVEEASKPTFNISVGDPVKIGDLTSSHIVYSVRTRVSTIGLFLPSAV